MNNKNQTNGIKKLVISSIKFYGAKKEASVTNLSWTQTRAMSSESYDFSCVSDKIKLCCETSKIQNIPLGIIYFYLPYGYY